MARSGIGVLYLSSLVAILRCYPAASSSAQQKPPGQLRAASSQVLDPAPNPKKWIAASTTAISITGDIVFSSETIKTSRRSFKLKFARDIDKPHLYDVAKIFDLGGPPSSARLYRTFISRRAVLANGNTICGPDKDGTWILETHNADYLTMAVFTGDSEPSLEYKIVEVGHNLCGSYGYVTADKSKR
jgi:hypothetical protein